MNVPQLNIFPRLKITMFKKFKISLKQKNILIFKSFHYYKISIQLLLLAIKYPFFPEKYRLSS